MEHKAPGRYSLRFFLNSNSIGWFEVAGRGGILQEVVVVVGEGEFLADDNSWFKFNDDDERESILDIEGERREIAFEPQDNKDDDDGEEGREGENFWRNGTFSTGMAIFDTWALL